MARDLLDLRQLVELLQRPGFLVVDEPAHLELPILAVDVGRVVEGVIAVERERFCYCALGEGRRQGIGIEDRRLHAIVEFRDLLQHLLGGKAVGDVAAGQKRQRAEAGATGDKASARQIRHHFHCVPQKELLVDAGDPKRANAAHDRSSSKFSGR